jgi:prepilin-type N-terminal cleavage/methylation domain-containing protein
MNKKHYNKGVTLIELIIAMAIFSIIVIAFLSMFSSAMISVINSGNKSQALGQTQFAVEDQLALNTSSSPDLIAITFSGVDINIPGRNIVVTNTIGNSQSTLKGFIPRFPSITLDLVATAEGALRPMRINVLGVNTNFNSSTRVEVWNRDYTTRFYSEEFTESTVAGKSTTEGYFDVTSSWLNYYGDFIVVLTSTVAGRQEIVKAKHSVSLPKLVVVGQNKVFVSEDGSYWFERSAATQPIFPTVTSLRSVSYHDNAYVALGGVGENLRVKANENWTKLTNTNSEPFTKIYNESETLYATTSNGKIFQSPDGNFNISPIYLDATVNFRGITANRAGVVVAVGNKIVTRTTDGTFVVYTPSQVINAVAVHSMFNESTNIWTYEFMAVGENGYILSSTDGVSWNVVTTSPLSLSGQTLSDVCYFNNRWIVVGSNGIIATYPNVLNQWSISSSGVTSHLRSVFGSQGKIYAVGDGAKIVQSGSNNFIFSSMTVPNGVDFKSISGR